MVKLSEQKGCPVLPSRTQCLNVYMYSMMALPSVGTQEHKYLQNERQEEELRAADIQLRQSCQHPHKRIYNTGQTTDRHYKTKSPGSPPQEVFLKGAF